MPRTIDLNADLGEGCPWDHALLGRVTSASVCCGAHAGDPETIAPDPPLGRRAGRGRRRPSRLPRPRGVRPPRRGSLDPGRDLDDDCVRTQLVGPRHAWPTRAGVTVRFVKPHGALYNQAQRDAGRRRRAAPDAPPAASLPILGQPGGVVERAGPELRRPVHRRRFADRRYRPDGRLVPRSEPDAILDDPDEIRDQVLALVDRGIKTLCIHGDDPRSVELADLVLATLKDAGIEPRSFA